MNFRSPHGLLRQRGAFSLVEILAAVAIVAVITFLAVPNIVRIKQDSEQNLAIARAEALNLGIAAFIQANGRSSAATLWSGAASAQARYALLAPYLAYAPAQLTEYVPGGYNMTLPANIDGALTKVLLSGPNGPITY